ncbi:UBX domain-containing protein 6 [Cyprinus carpio]|uniref:UBX domain-containing protein 6 n=1 Tax=Cyprinus carpio TaxID=7962 RepID=A0A9R0ARE1_CYPCA|nr:UBX domain-containing protein 6 [Cyprinus carpio]
MKKFFDDIKKDIKFKSVGPGKKLTDDSSSKPQAPQVPHGAPRKAPTEGAERAGAAALARIEQQHRPKLKTSQDAIRNQVKRELEAEAAATAASLKNTDVQGACVPQKDPSCFSVPGVFFICPLTGKTLTKTEKEMHIKEAILMRFSEDAIEASIMMIHNFNKDKEKVKAAVDIISKYIENICKNPTEEKYRKIKLSNKVFQENVSGIEGSREYLQALGFESTTLPVDGEDRTEEFLVLPAQESEALEQMKAHVERLQKGEPVRAKLDRQTQVFRPSKHATHFQLPPDFYNLTAEELKREQQQKSEVVERNAMLRTKAMREKEEQRERRKYNYALLRVRLPDENILQGTFLAWERVAALYQFVRDSLVNDWQQLDLNEPKLQKQKSKKAPAALLTFSWDAAVQADIAAAGGKTAVLLKAALLENIKTLS